MDIASDKIESPHIPSGNEAGSRDNPDWRPGGNTSPGGMSEAVMKNIGEGDYTWQKLN